MTRIARVVSLHCPVHFNIIAIVRCEEIGTDEQEDDARRVEISADLSFPFRSRGDAAAVPRLDDALALQETQVLGEFVAQFLALVRVGEKYLNRFRGLAGHGFLPETQWRAGNIMPGLREWRNRRLKSRQQHRQVALRRLQPDCEGSLCAFVAATSSRPI